MTEAREADTLSVKRRKPPVPGKLKGLWSNRKHRRQLIIAMMLPVLLLAPRASGGKKNAAAARSSPPTPLPSPLRKEADFSRWALRRRPMPSPPAGRGSPFGGLWPTACRPTAPMLIFFNKLCQPYYNNAPPLCSGRGGALFQHFQKPALRHPPVGDWLPASRCCSRRPHRQNKCR